MDKYKIIEKKHPVGDGIQKIYRFPNGYGASVVRFKIGDRYGSYTNNEKEWELAVIEFNNEDKEEFSLTYDTPITNDVIGHLTDEEVIEKLKQIKELK